MGRLALYLIMISLPGNSVRSQSVPELKRRYEAYYEARDYPKAGPLWRKIYAQDPREATRLLRLH